MKSLKLLEKGQSLIELLIVIALSSILLPSLLTGLVSSREGKAQEQQRLAAIGLLREANEAVRIVREEGWSTISTDGTYHPVVSGSTWTLVQGSESIKGYTRQIVISDVQRDANQNIVPTGGTVDPSTKLVTTTVSWNTPIQSNVSTSEYLTRYLGNATFVQTTQSDFNAGTLTNTTVTDTSGGEVTLAQQARGDWCKPNNSIVSTFNLSGQGITTDISATVGHAFTTTGGNSSGHSMDSIDISDPVPAPGTPVASNEAFYDNYKTYAVYSDGSYAYLTSDHPGLTVDIVEVSSTPYSEVGTFNGSGKGTSVYVSGNTGYVTVGSALDSFDLSSKSGARSELGSVTLSGTGQKVIVSGSYAYVATSSTTKQLQIVNISNPNSMSVVSSVNLGNNLAGVDVSLDNAGTHVYIVTAYSSGKSDFYIVDVSNPNSPNVEGHSSTFGTTPNGVLAISGNRAIIVGSGGSNLYQVLDTSETDNPEFCGGMTPQGVSSINAVAGVSESDGDVYSYILTNNSNAEFQIIEGGPGGGGYASSGTFESSTFDATPSSSAQFNRIDATIASPSATTIQLQVASATAVSGSCSGATFSYVGPDGTANTYFTSSDGVTIGGSIPYNSSGGYANPARCFRYKAFLTTTDFSKTPTLYDVTVNYSP